MSQALIVRLRRACLPEKLIFFDVFDDKLDEEGNWELWGVNPAVMLRNRLHSLEQQLQRDGRLPNAADRKRSKKEAAKARQQARREGQPPVYRGNLFDALNTTHQTRTDGGRVIVAGRTKTRLELIEARLRSIDRLERRKTAKLEKLRKQRK